MNLHQQGGWKRRGVSLLWGTSALREVLDPSDVVSIREFFVLAQAWPEELPGSAGSALVVAGLEGCLDVLNSADGETWLEADLRPVILAFQDEYQSDAALIFWLTTQAIQITSGHLLHIAIIVAAAGVYLAASLSDDPLWWTVSFSSMGTHGTFTSWIFNTSLVFAGLMILVWLPYFMNDLRVLERHGLTDANKVKWMRNGLIALGIAVGLVGVFENGVSQLTDNIHNISAPMMGVFVIILALALRRLLPNFSREVYATSGERTLLWFDLTNGPQGERLPMGSETTLATAPEFEVRAIGSFKQQPGCPAEVVADAPAGFIESGCFGECYNPTDERYLITRVEVVKITPQVAADEPLESLIFDPFVTTKTKGTGLGLAISQHIMEEHNGSIKCEFLDKGTRFSIRLPQHEPAELDGTPGKP